MHNIFNHRACEIFGTCDIDIPGTDFPPIPGISSSTMSEVQRVLKIGHGTSIIDMFKEIGDGKDLLSTVISYLVATNKVNDFINKLTKVFTDLVMRLGIYLICLLEKMM
ncbi:hypothetical protein COL01_10645 [Bacillus thuringiensis]|uniref:Uncharacterized protein n=1 Tax=Bacillus thuringiensis TaxID=1428 RepID=A0A9X6WLX5_BACTU|nr:hypothetical protein [Bacillus thuringiensis]PFJ38542.1 hypothetical protein COJ15_17810 [Bacillus thuringiensis]PFN46465.1 hypothetical protein COJ75_31365 [Bacillus thuringiensis]PFV34799.1 hypothetical protein COL01_10645 [Bacillus thuringiensis]